MKQAIASVASLLIVVWLQAYFFGAMRPLGVLPNLFLVMLTFLALLRPASQCLAIALAGGLMFDLVSGTDFGLRMAFYSLFVLGVVFVRQVGTSSDSFAAAAGIIAIGTALFNLVVLSSLAIGSVPFSLALAARQTAIELVVNLVLALVLANVWRWMFKSGPEGLPV